MINLKNLLTKIKSKSVQAEDISINTDSMSPEELYSAGINYSLFDEFAQAKVCFEACTQKDSSRPEYYIQLARTYLSLDKKDRSIRLLSDLLLRETLDNQLRISSTKLLLRLLDPKVHTSKVIRYFKQLRALIQPDSWYWQQKLQAELHHELWEEALETLKSLRRITDDDPDLEGQILISRLKARYKESDSAIPAVQKVLKSHTHCTMAYQYLIVLLRKKKDYSALLATWNRFFINKPDEASLELNQFEDDLFTGEMFGEALISYTYTIKTLKNPPLTLRLRLAKTLAKKGMHVEFQDQCLDLIRHSSTGAEWDIFLKELLPLIKDDDLFAPRFYSLLKEISTR